MTFYHSMLGVDEYIRMAEGYDGRELVAVLDGFLEQNTRVLEIGMGPGVDLDLLSERYQVTGSDFSQLFLDRYKSAQPDADLILLDAVRLDTDRTFDALYSNKVLHHLEDDDLQQSVSRQHAILLPNGLLLHSFWYGNRVEEHAGMKFFYRNEAYLRDLFSPYFEILQLKRYTEMEDNDSIYVLARRHQTMNI